MIKYIMTKDIKYNGQLYKGRKIIAHKDLLTLLLKVPEAIAYSGWRSLAEQKKMVTLGKSKTLNSNHRRGTAVDVINWKEVEPKMRKLGLINDISWDRNHFALGGEQAATKYPLVDELPKELDEHGKPKKAPQKKKKEPEVKVPTTTPETPPAVKIEPITPAIQPSVNQTLQQTPIQREVELPPTILERILNFLLKLIP